MGAAKLAICTPAYDGRAHVSFFRGIVDIRRSFEREGIETLQIDVGSSANLPRLRNSLAAIALDWGADAILWIDSDIAGNGADALRLWHSGKDIIGAAPQRRPAVYNDPPSVAFKPMDDGNIVLDNGLIEVGLVATAFCLTRRAVFEKLKSEGVAKRLVNTDGPKTEWFRNYFWYELVEAEGGYLDDGEDYYFCRKARALGFQCFIEPNIRPIHHEGSMRLPANFMDIHGKLFDGRDEG